MSRRARVIGAGLAGLSAAVELTRAGFAVDLIDSAGQAGGRCRSYHDPQLGQMIDNGNHLVLSGNRAVAAYLAAIGASDRLVGPDRAEFDFVDLTGAAGKPLERWSFRPNDGRVPWWIFSRRRRLSGTTTRDYVRLARLAGGAADETVGDRIEPSGIVWDHLIEPVLLAALNTAPASASAALTAHVIRQSLGRGGAAMRPLIAHPTLAAAFVEPALGWLAAHGGTVTLGQRIRQLHFADGALVAIDRGDGMVAVAPHEPVILATPAASAAALVPDLIVPDDYRAIVNAHFAFPPPPGTPRMIGLIGGTAEWIFAFPERLSVTVSAADRLVDTDREELARLFWSEIARVHALPAALPRWQIVKEKRATFAATPAQDARRPPSATRWRNLFLAGDWTRTGLPATIEGAVQSGATAARLAAALRAV